MSEDSVKDQVHAIAGWAVEIRTTIGTKPIDVKTLKDRVKKIGGQTRRLLGVGVLVGHVGGYIGRLPKSETRDNLAAKVKDIKIQIQLMWRVLRGVETLSRVSAEKLKFILPNLVSFSTQAKKIVDSMETSIDFAELEKSKLVAFFDGEDDYEHMALADRRRVWNAFIASQGSSFVIDRAKLQGLDLKGFNFTNVEFKYCDFDRVDFTGCKLTNAQMDLGSIFKSVKFVGADLTGIKIISDFAAHLHDLDFSRATLRGAQIYRVTIDNASFEGADCRKLFIKGSAFLGNISFKGTDMRGCTFDGVNASDATFIFEGADVKRSNFGRTELDIRGARNALEAVGGRLTI